MFISFSSIYNFWTSWWARLRPCVSALLWSGWTHPDEQHCGIFVCMLCVCLFVFIQLIAPTVYLCACMYFHKACICHTHTHTHTHGLSRTHTAVLQRHVIEDGWLWQVVICERVNQHNFTSGGSQSATGARIRLNKEEEEEILSPEDVNASN